MKPYRLLVATVVALLALAGCGGGGGGDSASSTASSTSSTPADDVAQLSFTDTTVGTGATFASGMLTTITYTGWLYSSTATDHKGAQFDTGSFSFTSGASQVITGLEQGMAGMQVGGKRTLLIPSSLGYGTSGYGAIPAGAGLVFEVTLTGAQAIGAAASPATLTTTDITPGTGAAAASGKSATVTYTAWLYSDTAADHKGAQFDAGTFSFTLGGGQVISGFEQGVTGMLVGGERIVLVPASLAYGASGYGNVPANSGLVFDVTLNAVQ